LLRANTALNSRQVCDSMQQSASAWREQYRRAGQVEPGGSDSGPSRLDPRELWSTGSKVVVLDPSGEWHAATVEAVRGVGGLCGRELRVRYKVPGLKNCSAIVRSEWLSVGDDRLRAAGGKLDPSRLDPSKSTYLPISPTSP